MTIPTSSMEQVIPGQGAMAQELLKTGGRAARFKLDASRPAIDLGALSR